MRFALFRISSTLSDQVGAEPTEAGKMFALALSGSETSPNAASQFEGVRCPVGVAVTIAGGGDGLVFSYFPELLSNEKTGRGNEATEAVSFQRAIARAVRGRFPQTRDLWKRVSMG